jgi:hypothetical protein
LIVDNYQATCGRDKSLKVKAKNPKPKVKKLKIAELSEAEEELKS